MSLLEWWGESLDPGPIGTVEFGARGRRPIRRGLALVRGLIGLTVLGGALVYLIAKAGAPWLPLLCATSAYLYFAYRLHPRPDPSNVGWLGGLVDHPFRYSDDANRWLAFFVVLLWPGRFIVESLVDARRALVTPMSRQDD